MNEVKRRIGIVRLYPAKGKFVEGGYVSHNDKVYRIVKLLDNDQLLLSDNSIISQYDCRLNKLFMVTATMTAEIHYNEYSIVKIGSKYRFECTSVLTKSEIGDHVEIFKYYLKDIWYSTKRKGVVLNIKDRKFQIELSNGDIVESKRHHFKLLNNNEKWIASVLRETL